MKEGTPSIDRATICSATTSLRMKPTRSSLLPFAADRSGVYRTLRWFAWWCALVCAATADGAAGPKLRIGVESNSPPLSFLDAQGRPIGFTNELLRELGRLSGIEFEIVASSWLFVSTEFQAGRLDALANVTITAERREFMAFSLSHAYLHATVYTRPGAPTFTSTAQFPGKTMATLKGTVGHLHAVDHAGWGARIVRYDTPRAMLEAVRDGQCDFAMLMRRLQPEQPDELGLHRGFVDDIVFPFHIAVHPDDRLTLERLNEALATLRANGTFDRIYAKWIGPIEPHPIHFADLRPFIPSSIAALGGVAALFFWQQRVKRRLVRQAAALRESEEKYRVLVDHADEAIYVVQDGRFRFLNRSALRLSGLTEAQILQCSNRDFARPEHRDEVAARQQKIQDGLLTNDRREYPIRPPAGGERWISVSGVRIVWEGRPATLNFATDITESRRAEQARQEAAERLEKIANRLPGFVFQARLHADGRSSLPYASDGIEQIYRVTAAEVREDSSVLFGRIHPDDLAGAVASLQRSARELTPCRHEFRVKFPDGTVRWLADSAAPQREPDGSVLWHGFTSDVTERKKAEELVRESLREKEALLKEVHHRVKNNLQVIASLLRLESGRSAEATTRAVLKSMQGRIRAMALLHESLYRTENFARVDLAAYLRQVATQLFRAQNPDLGAVRLGLTLGPADVDIDQAIPCGLIVNELVTNALKHGFPEGRGGEVRVGLHTDAAGQVHLEVSDDGVGLPADFETKRALSLGLQLVSDLAQQLRATLVAGSDASFNLTFTPRLPSAPAASPLSPTSP